MWRLRRCWPPSEVDPAICCTEGGQCQRRHHHNSIDKAEPSTVLNCWFGGCTQYYSRRLTPLGAPACSLADGSRPQLGREFRKDAFVFLVCAAASPVSP